MTKDRAKMVSEAGKTLPPFTRGKLQKAGNIERKREAGKDRRKREVSGQDGRVGISGILYALAA